MLYNIKIYYYKKNIKNSLLNKEIFKFEIFII
jgi:hypothetical protein